MVYSTGFTRRTEMRVQVGTSTRRYVTSSSHTLTAETAALQRSLRCSLFPNYSLSKARGGRGTCLKRLRFRPPIEMLINGELRVPSVGALIDERPVGAFQIRVIALCMGYLAPAIADDLSIPLPAFGPEYS